MWRGYWLAAFVGALPVWSVACGDGILKSDDFDRSCDVASDCVVVPEIGFCCSCEARAISNDELDEYRSAAACGDCDLACGFEFFARCVEDVCVLDRDCAPHFEYPCQNEDCPGGEGTKLCKGDGFSFGQCTCS